MEHHTTSYTKTTSLLGHSRAGRLFGDRRLAVSSDRSDVLLLGLNAVEGLAGTATKVAGHGLTLVAAGQGGLNGPAPLHPHPHLPGTVPSHSHPDH